jgi:hypothetical protein
MGMMGISVDCAVCHGMVYRGPGREDQGDELVGSQGGWRVTVMGTVGERHCRYVCYRCGAGLVAGVLGTAEEMGINVVPPTGLGIHLVIESMEVDDE